MLELGRSDSAMELGSWYFVLSAARDVFVSSGLEQLDARLTRCREVQSTKLKVQNSLPAQESACA